MTSCHHHMYVDGEKHRLFPRLTSGSYAEGAEQADGWFRQSIRLENYRTVRFIF